MFKNWVNQGKFFFKIIPFFAFTPYVSFVKKCISFCSPFFFMCLSFLETFLYVVHSISFETYFPIHLMRWLNNLYDFRFKWTATAVIGIHPTKALLSQLVNFKNAIWTLEVRYAIKFCFKLGKNAIQWKLDILLWPWDQETEFPVEAHWLSKTQEGQTEQIHPQTFDDPFFRLHWHDLYALGSYRTDNQTGIICWGFKGVQKEIPLEKTSTLQIRSVTFPPGQCTSLQLHSGHRLFDQDGNQDSSSTSLESRHCSLWLLVIS